MMDTTAPQIDCPEDVVLDCSDDFEPAQTGMATATDDCNEVTLDYSDETSGDDCDRTITRTWTATDECGNVASCQQTIRLIDNTAPQISCPEDVVFDCQDELDESILGEATATDNCNAISITSSDQMTNDGCEISIIRTWTAEDDCGNSSTCEQSIELIDNTPPEISCPENLVVACDASIEPSETGEATATDDCNTTTISFTDDDFAGDDCEQIIVRTWVAEDACDNRVTCEQTIKLVDNNPPTLECPNDIDIDCTATFDTSETGMATATDDCSEVMIAYSDEMNGDACNRIITRTWIAEDDCGNSSTCEQSIRLIDSTPPSLECPEDIEIDCKASTDASSTGIATATDDCSEVIITHSDEMSGDACNRIITRTWTAEDDCGNSSTCEQIIELIDNTPPEISCPDDVTIDCDGPANPNTTGEATMMDDCNEGTITFTDNVETDDCESQTTRTWRAEDACGNFSSCIQIIRLIDNTPPEVNCPDDIVINCSESTDPTHTGEPQVEDDCSSINVTFIDEATNNGCNSTINRTWSIEDACGNIMICQQEITIMDDSLPEINCPADTELNCSSTPLPSETGMATATDDCSEIMITHSDELNGDDCNRLIIRTWVAEDACGNIASCEQIIELIDNSPPTITCPANMELDCNETTEPEVAGEATATDDCNTIDISFEDNVEMDDCLNTITRTWTATDACGNASSCEQIIEVRDNELPTITCPDDIVIECGESTAPEHTGQPIVTDDCTTVNVTFTDIEVGNECDRIITRTFVVEDACGNRATCVQLIKIEDTRPPELEFDHPLLEGVEDGDTVLVNCDGITIFTQADVVATDICTAVNVTFEEEGDGGNCVDDGYHLQLLCTWTATDLCGNSSSIHIVVRIVDLETPEIEFNHPMLNALNNGDTLQVDCMDMPNFDQNDVSVNDNCDSTLVVEIHRTPEDMEACHPFIMYTWSVTDECGNHNSIEVVIQVEDNEAPVIQGVPDDLEVECDDIPPVPNVLASDNCDTNVELDYVERLIEQDDMCVVNRMWTATDNCGNTSTASYNISRVNCTDCTNPFLAHFIDFTATEKEEETVELKWTFSNVPITHRFYIERGNSAADFNTIGVVEGIIDNGNLTYEYSFIDQKPRKANNFYRIRELDATGEVITSDIQHIIMLENRDAGIMVYPNPTENTVWVELVNLEQTQINYILTDKLGRVLDKNPINPNDGLKARIDMSLYPAGVYTIYFKYGNNQRQVFKLVKVE